MSYLLDTCVVAHTPNALRAPHDTWIGHEATPLAQQQVRRLAADGMEFASVFVNDPVSSKFGPGVVENLLTWLQGKPLVCSLKPGP